MRVSKEVAAEGVVGQVGVRATEIEDKVDRDWHVHSLPKFVPGAGSSRMQPPARSLGSIGAAHDPAPQEAPGADHCRRQRGTNYTARHPMSPRPPDARGPHVVR